MRVALKSLCQQGFATLLVTLILLLCMGTLTLTVSRSGIIEQQLTGNELRTQEVQFAADAGLDYAIAWASQHAIPSQTDTVICGTAANCPPIPNNLKGNDGGGFTLSLTFTRNAATPNYIKITATATQAENNSSATSSTYIKQDNKTFALSQLPGTWKDF